MRNLFIVALFLAISTLIAMMGGVTVAAASASASSSSAMHHDRIMNLNNGGRSGGGDARAIHRGVPKAIGTPAQATNPIVAIVVDKCRPSAAAAKKLVDKDVNSCMDDFYVRWLESAGVRVVPLFAYWPWERQLEVLQQVNGALLPGGTITGDVFTAYINNVTRIVEYSLAEPEFMLWGTCQGMQVISIVINNHDESVLKCDYEGMYPLMMPLDFTAYRPYSTMFSLAAEEQGVVDDLANYPTTVNYHHCGVNPNIWAPTLTDKSKIISTNVDVTGKPFISTFEIVGGDKQNNIFATQYHPERAPYEYDEDPVYRLPQTLAVSNYLAQFARGRAMRNRHAFTTPDAAEAAVINNYQHVYDGWGGGTYWLKL